MRKYFKLSTKLVSAFLSTVPLWPASVTLAQQTESVLECRAPGSMSRAEEAQCACEAALRENTIEALENFILRYGNDSSACFALAQAALSKFSPNGSNSDHNPGNSVDTGPYGG